MRVLRPAALVVLLALSVGGPAAFAAPARATARPARQEIAGAAGIIGRLRGLLVSLWSPAGCEIDPLGRCIQAAAQVKPPAAVTPTADEACEIDPLGRCAASR
jgi:hypothetical protein